MSLSEKIFELIRTKMGPIEEVKTREKWYKLSINRNKYDHYISDGQQGYTISKGEKSGKKYIILRYSYPLYGVCGIMHDVLFGHAKAKHDNAVLLVDFEGAGAFRKRNTWGHEGNNVYERYFKQTISVSDALSLKQNDSVVTIKCDTFWLKDENTDYLLNNRNKDWSLKYISGHQGEEYRNTVRNISKDIFIIQDKLKKQVDEIYKDLFNIVGNGRVLGVLMREHFSVDGKRNVPEGRHKEVLAHHPTTVGVDDILDLVKEKFDEWNVNFIFVATLYDETIEKFENIFGKDKILYIERKRLASYDENETIFDNNSKHASWEEMMNECIITQDIIKRTDEYMIELFLLSKCDYFISPICSGGFWVPIFRENEFNDIYYLKNIN